MQQTVVAEQSSGTKFPVEPGEDSSWMGGVELFVDVQWGLCCALGSRVFESFQSRSDGTFRIAKMVLFPSKMPLVGIYPEKKYLPNASLIFRDE